MRRVKYRALTVKDLDVLMREEGVSDAEWIKQVLLRATDLKEEELEEMPIGEALELLYKILEKSGITPETLEKISSFRKPAA